VTQLSAGRGWASLSDCGVPAAVAAERLRAAAQHFDLAAFEAMIAATRPELWKRMDRQPSRIRLAARRLLQPRSVPRRIR
jgi:hypothetical protein